MHLPGIDASIIFIFVSICGGLVALIALLMFGQAIFEAILAAFHLFFAAIGHFFRVLGHSLLALGWYIMGLVAVLGVAGAWLGYMYWFKPGGLNLARLRPPVCAELLDRKGVVLDYLCPFDGVRVWRPIEAISNNLRMLVVMLEDDKFYEHAGLDIDEIWNAIEKDIEKSKAVRGASTITQQLAKNLFLTRDKTIFRKASEVPLTMRLERELTKDQILELYLNTIEWGPGVYGVEAASRLYFDHEASTLTEQEAWLLALMIPNPKELNLWVSPRGKKSLQHRAKHLATRLHLEHHMSKEESQEALLKFERFLEQWAQGRPQTMLAGRKFPARWSGSRAFSLAEVTSIRRAANGLMRRYTKAPLRSYFDKDLQVKLELLPQQHIKIHELSNVIAIMEGEQIRALIPVADKEVMAEVSRFAEDMGLRAQVFAARNIPATALWP